MRTKSIMILLIVFSISCKRNQKNDLWNCEMKEVDFNRKLDSLLTLNRIDTVDLRTVIEYDTLFIYEPYTYLKKIESMHDCRLSNGYQDDDTWYYIIFKLKDGGYYFTKNSRRFDFSETTPTKTSKSLVIIQKIGNQFKISFVN